MNSYYTLRNKSGRIVAAGSWDAIRAAARLLFGPNATIFNPFERDIFNALDEQIRLDIDKAIFASLENSANNE